MIFHWRSKAGVDLLAIEMSVRREIEGGLVFARKADPTAFDFALGREDPIEAVEDAFAGVAVSFEAVEDALNDRGFAGAIGSVKEQQAGISSLANKVSKHTKESLLDLFLSRDPRGFGSEGAVVTDALVKDAKAGFFAVGRFDGASAVKAKGVLDILCGVSAVSGRIFGDFGEIFAERKDAAGLFKALLYGSRKREKVKRFHASMLLIRRARRVVMRREGVGVGTKGGLEDGVLFSPCFPLLDDVVSFFAPSLRREAKVLSCEFDEFLVGGLDDGFVLGLDGFNQPVDAFRVRADFVPPLAPRFVLCGEDLFGDELESLCCSFGEFAIFVLNELD